MREMQQRNGFNQRLKCLNVASSCVWGGLSIPIRLRPFGEVGGKPILKNLITGHQTERCRSLIVLTLVLSRKSRGM